MSVLVSLRSGEKTLRPLSRPKTVGVGPLTVCVQPGESGEMLPSLIHFSEVSVCLCLWVYLTDLINMISYLTVEYIT